MVMQTVEELHGSMVLANIMSVIWLGDWDRYETIFAEIPAEVSNQFPFHQHYQREKVEVWHENHFCIPGEFFISPYFSSYSGNGGKNAEESRKSLLCLIGLYEKLGFYYPLENNLYPDHLGCLMVFVRSLIQEQIKAKQDSDVELYNKLVDLEVEILSNYIQPMLKPLQKNASNHVQHPFIKEFLECFCQSLDKEEFLSLS
ncbi:hypothetical protein BACCIP111895_02202 [Neobacillus rhizosphaerae]|uniref:Nitrate reductase delta subunit n=1 Tax=Neobacillus rhizosphaerae TaxID=2880965 RepID=A0ABM9EQV9_9BACI|nr:molecular chaperone TorD family protein [Neobacillus rhizosphaerae]CAH2715025.1 hypothetical protein BACCIP111895_02202 [Neobacillus rhizosphaerae]